MAYIPAKASYSMISMWLGVREYEHLACQNLNYNFLLAHRYEFDSAFIACDLKKEKEKKMTRKTVPKYVHTYYLIHKAFSG